MTQPLFDNGPTAAGAANPRISRRQALRITAVAAAVLGFGGWLGRGVLRGVGLHRVRETRVQLGTLVTISVMHPESETARAMIQGAFAEIERLENILSRHRASTPLARLNREGVLIRPPDELLEVLNASQRVAAWTDGAFDVTVAPLLDLYAFRARTAAPLPTAAEVRQRLQLVDWRRLRIDEGAVRLASPGMAITLDGVAKGYIVERAARVLRAAGAERVLVDAGGDMASANGNAREPWRVAIQDPRNASGSLGVVELRGEAVATSGDYLENFTPDFRLHHILDPRTGRSPEETSSVTVRAPTAVEADALSTAVFVLGPDAGLALLRRLEGVDGLIVTKDRRQLATGDLVS